MENKGYTNPPSDIADEFDEIMLYDEIYIDDYPSIQYYGVDHTDYLWGKKEYENS
jgi:hypothetical protein